MAEPTVSAGFVRGLMDLAASKGADRKSLAERAKIDPEALQDQDNRIPFANYMALMRAAKDACNDPALALHYGEAVNIADVSIVGLIGQASETMVDAFMQLNRYVRLVVDVDVGTADRFQLRYENGGMWFIDTRRDPNDFPELTESAFAQFVCGARRFGDAPLLKAAHFTHAEPQYRAEYDRIFRVPIAFNKEWNAMLVDEACLTIKISLLPRYVFGVLSERAEELLEELGRANSVRASVEGLLMPILHKGDVSMDTIAGKLALSRQTLFRKLKAEGTTFEKVLDELRHKMALHYLSGKKTSVNETAYLVGFSEAASFSRAFKRWTGSSPSTVRAPPSH